MQKKLIILALVTIFVLPFPNELSYSQQINFESNLNIPKPIYSKKLNKSKDNQNIYITMEATAYDLSVQCCGKYYSDPGRGITKYGYDLNNKYWNEVYIVSSNNFPMGTKLKLEFPESHKKYNGVYTVHDTGNFKDNVLDVYIGDFGEKVGQETINFGRVNVKVYVIKKKIQK